ncbi:MAG: hypothetical protein EOP61_03245 [Sphingomonadales bacterium]|nr:MAG: hypothetical protein EOP61_03245 [Sphingomonadales bacterium]
MIDRKDAASALASIEQARERSGEFRRYAAAGNKLIGWGLVWLVCNLCTQLIPVWGSKSWLIGVPAGILWSMTGSSGLGGNRGRGSGRYALMALAVFGFFASVMAVTGVNDQLQANVIVSLTVATVYIVVGLWAGPRFAWIGLALAAIVLAGWFGDRAHLYLWLAVGGGGALLISGLWLRRA